MTFANRARQAMAFVGPFPYNPKLVFLFFLSHDLSRYLPEVASAPSFFPRLKIFLATLLISCITSSAYSLCTYLFKRYRFWSSKNFIYYYCELISCLALGASTHWLILKILEPFGLPFKLEFNFRKSPVFFLWASLLMLLVFALMHFAERNVLRRLENANLLNAQLQKARIDMLLTEEQLRQQTAAFLHDRVQAQITVAALSLSKIQATVDANVAVDVSEIRSRLEKIRRVDLKTVSQRLSPNIDAMGLKSTIEDFVSDLNIVMNCFIDIDESALEGKSRMAFGVFRIIEQAIINSVTHGPARNVRVKVSKGPNDSVVLLVEDDGPGVNLTESIPGVGTTVIDSWVMILDGAKEVISHPGEGFRLRVYVPTKE
jgi:signal transduction histidine kinase